MSELLELRGIGKAFGGTQAVSNLSFGVPAGQLTSLVGPNGAGKSTVLNLIAGRLRPDTGTMLFRGEPLPCRPHEVALMGIGRLFQEVRLCCSLTVLENVILGLPPLAGEGIGRALLRARRVRAEDEAARERARELLDFVGLGERAGAPAASLSYGQQKLVAIARLLAGNYDLLLLDEPASGVNPRLVDELAALLRRITSAGRTVLLVEHNLTLVRRVSDQMVLLDRGELRAVGPTAEVWDSSVMAEVYLAPVV